MFEDLNHTYRNRRCFGTAAIIIAAALFGMTSSLGAQPSKTAPAGLRAIKGQQRALTAIRLSVEGEVPSLGSGTAWLNSQPLTAAGLRGKVVLIDFWTYSCINWRRQLPYVRARSEEHTSE